MSNNVQCDFTDDCGDRSDENPDWCWKVGFIMVDFEDENAPFGIFSEVGMVGESHTYLFMFLIRILLLPVFTGNDGKAPLLTFIQDHLTIILRLN